LEMTFERGGCRPSRTRYPEVRCAENVAEEPEELRG